MNQLISIFMKQASCLTMMMFLVFSISIVQAQTKAGKMIDDGKFDDAEEYLIKKLEKDPNAVDLLFDRAKLYSNEGYAKFDIEKSYGYIKRSEQYFKKVKEEKDLKDLEKSGITSGTIGLMLDQINGKAYSEVAKKNNIATYNNFIKVHPETKQYVNQAIAERNKLAYQDAVSENTCLAYDDFMRYYPDAVQVPEAKKKYDDLFAKFLPEYTEAVKDGEMSTLQKFLFKNQAFPRTDSLFRKDYLLAQEAVDIGLSERLAYSPFESVGESGQQDDELNKRLKREGAKSGDIQISLMWDNFNDLDLHVREPSGEEMTFEHKKSATRGELDVDMNNYYGGEDENEAMNDSENSRKASTSPVENIYWPENEAPNGNFRVWVKYFLNYKFAIEYLDTAERLIHVNDPTNFSVRVSVNGKAKSFSNHTTYVPEILRKHIFAFDYYSHLLLPVEWTGKMKSRYDAYIKSAAPRELSYVAVQRLMSFPLIEKKFEEALDVIKKYEGHFASSEELSARIIGLKQIIERHDPGITVESLGKAINSAGAEYSPVISADDQLLYFCGNDRIGSLGKEDIWVAKREYSPLEIIGTDTIVDNVGHWGTAALLPVLNTKDGNEAPLSVSVDGNVLMLFSGGDIFYSERTKTGWSELQKFPAPINTEFWEGDAMLSSDGNSIIFVSNRPGGMNKNIDQNFYHGDLTFASDIYVCTRTGEKWSDPVNLGKTINTAFSERSPFLHPDMKTLYFSSDGHAGLGCLDVYKTTRSDENDWTKWSDPVNLGREINTSQADWGYKINTSGEWAFFSRGDFSSEEKENIFRILLPEYLRPDVVVTVSGIVSDNHGNPLDASLVWEDLLAAKEIGNLKSNPADGSYFIILPAGKNYGYFAEKAGYYPVSKSLDLQNINKFTQIREDIVLVSIDEMKKSGIAVLINNIFFDHDKTELKPESFPELNRLVEVLMTIRKSDASAKVEIMGHTDNSGSDSYNQTLSEGRAKAVMQYLLEKGVPQEALQYKGYGESKPVADNNTDDGKAKNRRVEFRFVD